jgi:hypothetical protein
MTLEIEEPADRESDDVETAIDRAIADVSATWNRSIMVL